MDENETLSNAFDKLGEMLSTEEGQKQISDILSMFSGDENTAKAEDNQTKQETNHQGFTSSNFDMLNTAKKLLSSSKPGKSGDKNAAFLEALKPFLRKERRNKLDGAIKLIGAASLFKELGVFTKGGD